MNLDELKMILVPTDFSEASFSVLGTAIRLAQTFRAAVHVLHVHIDPTFTVPLDDLATAPMDLDGAREVITERLDRMAEQVKQAGVACTTASVSGRTPMEIVDHARQVGAGLIVVGSHHRHGIDRVLLGSVAEKVVQHAPCPMLVLPLQGN